MQSKRSIRLLPFIVRMDNFSTIRMEPTTMGQMYFYEMLLKSVVHTSEGIDLLHGNTVMELGTPCCYYDPLNLFPYAM